MTDLIYELVWLNVKKYIKVWWFRPATFLSTMITAIILLGIMFICLGYILVIKGIRP